MFALQVIRNLIAYPIIFLGEMLFILGFTLLSSDEKVSFSGEAVKSIQQVFRKYGL